MTTVLFAGGGTAGHVFPAVAVARALMALDETAIPVFVGTRDRLEGRLVPAAGFALHHLDVLPLPRRPTLALARVPFALRRSVRQAAAVARDQQAAAVATFGGYVSLPAAWAARQLGLPLVLHEQNAVPGLANRVAARWADRIAVTFPGSEQRFPGSPVVTGNPVRLELLAFDPDERQHDARVALGLDPQRATLLVFGGSQGARTINRAVVGTWGRWREPARLQILHAAGRALHHETASAWEQARASGDGPAVRCVDFLDDMALAYAAADAVVCRAGATSIAELTALGRPALLVPYPHATGDHQLHNALAVERAGAGAVVENHDLTPQAIVDRTQPWLLDAAARRAASAAARTFGRRDAATRVARLILDVTAAKGHS